MIVIFYLYTIAPHSAPRIYPFFGTSFHAIFGFDFRSSSEDLSSSTAILGKRSCIPEGNTPGKNKTKIKRSGEGCTAKKSLFDNEKKTGDERVLQVGDCRIGYISSVHMPVLGWCTH
jgi:hypothetical protein